MRFRAECLYPDCHWSITGPLDRLLPDCLKHEGEKPRHAVRVIGLARAFAEALRWGEALIAPETHQ